MKNFSLRKFINLLAPKLKVKTDYEIEKKGLTQNVNSYSMFKGRFSKNLTHTFIEYENGRKYSFKDLDEASARFARFFENIGLRQGERVLLCVDKSAEAIFLYLACLRYCVVLVPISVSLKEKEIEYVTLDARPSLIVCRPEDEKLFERIAARLGDAHIRTLDRKSNGSLMNDSNNLPPLSTVKNASSGTVARIMYTSGTTGRPKGAMRHHLQSENLSDLLRIWRINEKDTILHALNFVDAHGFFAVHLALHASCKIFLISNTQPNSILKNLPQTTVFMGSPVIYGSLLKQNSCDRENSAHVRLFLSGTAPLPEDVFTSFKNRTGKEIVEWFGMSEAGVITTNPPGAARGGSCGKPLPRARIRIVDEQGKKLASGEYGFIEVQTPSLFEGYLSDVKKTRDSFSNDGYFITGDMGKFDDEGYLWILGRSKDMVLVNGANVYPREIETYIDSIRGVEESAVFGVPNPDSGESVLAIVKKDVDGTGVTEDSILTELKAKVADYKVPQRIYFVEEIPRNEAGKIQKNQLREMYATDSNISHG